MPKIFALDTGAIHFLRKISPEILLETIEGSIIENFVFSIVQNQFSDDEIFFYRTISKSEIDFVVQSMKGLIPIECKFQNGYNSTPSAFHSFQADFKTPYCLVVTQNTCLQKGNIFYIPAEILPFIQV